MCPGCATDQALTGCRESLDAKYDVLCVLHGVKCVRSTRAGRNTSPTPPRAAIGYIIIMSGRRVVRWCAWTSLLMEFWRPWRTTLRRGQNWVEIVHLEEKSEVGVVVQGMSQGVRFLPSERERTRQPGEGIGLLGKDGAPVVVQAVECECEGKSTAPPPQ